MVRIRVRFRVRVRVRVMVRIHAVIVTVVYFTSLRQKLVHNLYCGFHLEIPLIYGLN